MNLKLTIGLAQNFLQIVMKQMFPVRLKFLFSYVTPRTPSSPRLIHFTEEVAEILGITREEAQSAEFTIYSLKRVAS
jgi:hypothetical protein